MISYVRRKQPVPAVLPIRIALSALTEATRPAQYEILEGILKVTCLQMDESCKGEAD
jgi:hypothetical protein